MRAIIEKAFSWLERQEKMRRTVRELYALSDRELSDIGIHRSDIYRVVREYNG